MKKRGTLIFIFLSILISSCVEPLDFNQADELEFNPVFKSTLIYFTVDQTDFIDLITGVNFVSNSSPLTVLKDPVIQENLLKAELEFVFNNTFDRDFTIEISFLDNNNQITYGFSPILIPPLSQNVKHLESITIADNQLFLSSTKVRVQIAISPSPDGSVLDPNNVRKLELKSAGTYYLKYE